MANELGFSCNCFLGLQRGIAKRERKKVITKNNKIVLWSTMPCWCQGSGEEKMADWLKIIGRWRKITKRNCWGLEKCFLVWWVSLLSVCLWQPGGSVSITHRQHKSMCLSSLVLLGWGFSVMVKVIMTCFGPSLSIVHCLKGHSLLTEHHLYKKS